MATLPSARMQVLTRVLKRIEEDVRYHSELFDEPTSALILSRIESMGLPNTLRALGSQLLDHCSELLALAMQLLRGMAAGVVEQRMKAVRAVAAQKTLTLIERVRTSLVPLRAFFFRSRAQLGETLDELIGLLDECTAQVTPHVPQQRDDDSDDDYF